MLTSSNSPYQHKSIRNAIRNEEHHIIRVAEEETGETYDLNLSHSTPYASPVVTRSSANSTSGKGSDVGAGKIIDTSKKVNGHAINGSGGGSDDRTTVHTSSTVSHRRILQLPHIVSRRHGGNTNKDPPTEMEQLVSEQVSMGVPRIVGELPPSPPLEPEYRNGLSNGNMFESAIPKESQEGERGRSDPRRPLRTNGSTSANATRGEDVRQVRGTRPRREASDASFASTTYLSASSYDGSEDEDVNSFGRSSTSKFGPAPMVSEPTSFLHPSSAQNHEAGNSLMNRRPSPVSTLSSTNAQIASTSQPRPTRRNTTGSGTSPGQKSRAGSVGSSGTRGSLRGSREREYLSPTGFQEEEQQMSSPSPTEPPLRTGDAGLDEAIAKQYDQMRRQRETKKKRQQTGEPEQLETTIRGGSSLARVRSGRKVVDEEPRVLIGNVIGEEHDNYVLMYNMLTGIRIGVSRCQAKVKRPLTEADYSAKHKFTFDIIGNELTPSAKYDFKFKDYAPWVFRELREYFRLDPGDYLLSLTAKYILSELGSPGKSGSFFYFSRDYRFIIKTIRHNEHKFLLRILKEYHMHVKLNPHTLLSRFYGLHRVKLPGGRKIHFVIMNNIFPPHRDIHETYDLKGSAIGREYPEERAAQKKGAVLKDLNWVNRKRELQLGPEKKALFEAQICSDVALLQRLGIMDYSLLIGLHDMNRGNSEGLREDALQVVQPDSNNTANTTAATMNLKRAPTTQKEKDAFALRTAVQRSDAKALGSTSTAKLPERETSDRHHFIFYQDEGGFRSTDEYNRPTDWVYYFGIIDTLTLYNSVKRGEHYWKSLTNNHNMISSVHPIKYGQRFCNFLFSVIKGADQSQRPRMH